MPKMPLLYERQPGETDRAFAAFCCYRDLGSKRSLDEVGKRLYGDQTGRKRGSTGRIREWSARWHWRERVSAWDMHLEYIAREAQEQARREMVERHAKVAVALQEKAIQRLKAIKPDELSPADLLRFAIEAAKLERLARGEPETVTEERQTADSEEELAVRRREFFVELGQTLAPYPEAKQAVGELLERRIEADQAAEVANGHMNGNELPANRR